jgi:hypothetical protein
VEGPVEHTPILVAQQSAHEKQCDAELGGTLLDNWRKSREVLFDGNSKIELWGQDSANGFTRSISGGLRSFRLKNVAVDFSKAKVPAAHGSQGSDQVYESGFIYAAGDASDNRAHMTGARLDSSFLSGIWKEQYSKLQGLLVADQLPNCQHHESVPTMFISRDTWRNNFHVMTELMLVFMLSQVHSLGLEVQLVFLDGFAPGPWWPLWQSLSAFPILHFDDIGRNYSGTPLPIVCFDTILLPPATGAAMIWEAWDPSPCTVSPILVAVARHFLVAMDVLDVPPAHDIVITFVSRAREQSRRLGNEAELVALLNSDSYPMVSAQAVDFGDHDAAEQLRIARTTSIMIGVHGAGLTHLMYMHPHSVLVELQPRRFVGRQSISYLFRNMAKWMGLVYFMERNTDADAEDDMGNFSIAEDRIMPVIDAAVRHARGAGRGVASCGLQCGEVPKPRLWTPISYTWDTAEWIAEHTAYERRYNWPEAMPDQ